MPLGQQRRLSHLRQGGLPAPEQGLGLGQVEPS
jgi:hypothetical protein